MPYNICQNSRITTINYRFIICSSAGKCQRVPEGANLQKAAPRKTVSVIFVSNLYNRHFMQHEDDLRGLAKVIQFMRAISILLLVIHIYWFCYR